MTLLLLPSVLCVGDAMAEVAAPLADVLLPPFALSGASASAGCITLLADALLLPSVLVQTVHLQAPLQQSTRTQLQIQLHNLQQLTAQTGWLPVHYREGW